MTHVCLVTVKGQGIFIGPVVFFIVGYSHGFDRNDMNSVWPSHTIWRLRSWSTLAQVMVCCLTAPSHYLSQCWLLHSEVLCYSPVSNLAMNAQATVLYNKFENYTLEITATSPGSHGVKTFSCWIVLKKSGFGPDLYCIIPRLWNVECCWN